VGKRVYNDATRIGDPGLLSFGDDAVVDRGALLLAHSGIYDHSGMHLLFKPLSLGANSVVGPRSVLMPGLAVTKNQSVPAGELMMPAAN
jgi:acetyltransferase-like isoleucine patch superfamily enzyme